jgi:hypothetical protein
MNSLKSDLVRGVAAGVPYVALPPADRSSATTKPVVIAWHLTDAPRTPEAFAAALPLYALDAWRVYLCLPLCGDRMPDGGVDEVMRLGFEDAVMNLHGPIVRQAADEFSDVLTEIREQLQIDEGPLALVGGSSGSAVAQLVLTEAGESFDIRAAVLISPVVQLKPVVDATARLFGFEYEWHDEALAVAKQLDFAERLGDAVAKSQPALLYIVGEVDDQDSIVRPAQQVTEDLRSRYDDANRVEFVVVKGMAHALAEDPGIEPAAQTPHAAEVDAHAVRWLQRHLA